MGQREESAETSKGWGGGVVLEKVRFGGGWVGKALRQGVVLQKIGAVFVRGEGCPGVCHLSGRKSIVNLSLFYRGKDMAFIKACIQILGVSGGGAGPSNTRPFGQLR